MKLAVSSMLVACAAAASKGSLRDAPANPTVTLNNGVEMPLVAIGVWQYDNATTADAVTKALSIGITHIDTAWNCTWRCQQPPRVRSPLAFCVRAP